MRQILGRVREPGKSLSILIALLLGLCFVAVNPLIQTYNEQQDARAQTIKLIVAYQTNIARRGEYENELAQLEKSRQSTSGLIEGSVAAIAAAKMQNDIRTIIESNGGDIRTTQNLEPTHVDPFERIDLSYNISLPMGKLAAVLYQIETHNPYFFIDKVDIRMPENWQPDDAHRNAPMLDVKWVVSGYRWAGT